jgi:hypothetical protein
MYDIHNDLRKFEDRSIYNDSVAVGFNLLGFGDRYG